MATVPDFLAGEYVTAAELQFLVDPPACRIFHNTTQSAADNAFTVVTFNDERWDNDTMHSSGVNPERITFTTAGLYVITFCWELAAAADYTLTFSEIRLNSTTSIVTSRVGPTTFNTNWAALAQAVYKFAAGDWVDFRVFQKNGANAARNILSGANFSPEASASWIGKG